MKKIIKNSKLKIQGFSLVELLVAMVITGIMFTLVTSSYWLFLKSHLKAENSRDLQQEVRFALTRITDKIRTYNLDYSAYIPNADCPPSANLNEQLCLNGYIFKKDGTNLLMNDQSLFSENKFVLESIFFQFSPNEDPLKNIANSDLQMQPKITVYIRVKSKRYPNIKFQAQTTISSRKYK